VTTTARELMHSGPATTRGAETLCDAARTMRDQHVEELLVCDDDRRLTGMLTGHDIVVLSVAVGDDPRTTRVASLPTRSVASVDADDSAESAFLQLVEQAVRRLPVTERGRLVGMLTQSDVVRALTPATMRQLVGSLVGR
jgi:CBS domain-containing protein